MIFVSYSPTTRRAKLQIVICINYLCQKLTLSYGGTHFWRKMLCIPNCMNLTTLISFTSFIYWRAKRTGRIYFFNSGQFAIFICAELPEPILSGYIAIFAYALHVFYKVRAGNLLSLCILMGRGNLQPVFRKEISWLKTTYFLKNELLSFLGFSTIIYCMITLFCRHSLFRHQLFQISFVTLFELLVIHRP